MNPILFISLMLITGATCYMIGRRFGRKEAELKAVSLFRPVTQRYRKLNEQHGDECGDGGL